jgi:hypothetical protein
VDEPTLPSQHHRSAPDQGGPEVVRFDFAEAAEPVPWWSRLFGVTEQRAYVAIAGDQLRARFGPWFVETPVANIRHLEITGPYRLWRIAGPARYSPADRGLTFATRNDRGVLICFDEPVTGLDPLGRLRHPNLTVTVADPEGLVAALVAAGGRISGHQA